MSWLARLGAISVSVCWHGRRTGYVRGIEVQPPAPMEPLDSFEYARLRTARPSVLGTIAIAPVHPIGLGGAPHYDAAVIAIPAACVGVAGIRSGKRRCFFSR